MDGHGQLAEQMEHVADWSERYGFGTGVIPAGQPSRIKSYTLYNLTASYTGIKNTTLTGGITNLFNTDPPFANSYDTNTGSGSSWEPRVADPRGRSFIIGAEYKFF